MYQWMYDSEQFDSLLKNGEIYLPFEKAFILGRFVDEQERSWFLVRFERLKDIVILHSQIIKISSSCR